MGGPGPVHGNGPGLAGVLLVAALTKRFSKGEVTMKDYLIPFTAGFVVWGAVFLAIDYAVMSLQGLSLIFHP